MMLRCLKILGGIVEVLGRKIWTATKVTASNPMIVSRAIIRPLLHYRLSAYWGKKKKKKRDLGFRSGRLTAYSWPPHWSANRRQTTHGMSAVVPGASSCDSFLVQGSFVVSRSGTLRQKAMTAMAMAPKGRLM